MVRQSRDLPSHRVQSVTLNGDSLLSYTARPTSARPAELTPDLVSTAPRPKLVCVLTEHVREKSTCAAEIIHKWLVLWWAKMRATRAVSNVIGVEARGLEIKNSQEICSVRMAL